MAAVWRPRPLLFSAAARCTPSAAAIALGQTAVQTRWATTRRPPPKRRGEMSPSLSMKQMGNGAVSGAMISFRIPHTFVPPPMAEYLRTPKLLWYRVRAKAVDLMTAFSVRLQSKPSFLGKARFRPRNATLVPMAKAMHAQMLEATAAGDTVALGRLLTHSHMSEVAGLLARRPRGRRCEWELLRYLGAPRLVDSKVVMVPGGGGAMASVFLRQVVVSIRSRQRFTWTDTHGAVAKPVSVVEKDVRENVVLVATLDRTTWETSEWRIFGFMPETTLALWEDELALVNGAAKDGSTA